jgi:uncharacterized membrane protein YhaH (DUF805 family)
MDMATGEFPPAQHPPARQSSVFGLWFGVRDTVGPLAYGVSGLFLMALKYTVEAAVIWSATRAIYLPWHFLNPLISARFEMAQRAPEWLGWVWFAWSLPFLWIAVTMSVRRAADAGWSPWSGFLVLIPLVNLVFMVTMCFVPTSHRRSWATDGLRPDARPSGYDAALSVGASLVFGGAMLVLSVYVLSSYGASLFVGTPTMMAALAAFLYNRTVSRSLATSIGVGAGAVFFAGVALLLFALEGAICIMMALPVFIPLGLLGALLGKAIADATRRPTRGLAACIAALPLWALAENAWQETAEYVVATAVVIDASPEVVWANVVDFPELPEESQGLLRWGIAAPLRARIEGQGVGATRYCEFTTGDFVEPIRVWDPPRRLAFDVTDQPPAMIEWSPYGDIHPPHLDGFMCSNRGEFLLLRLRDGRTRLEGRTWYEIRMFPQWYWTLWCDTIVHRIHGRVLRHIQEMSEEFADPAFHRTRQRVQ